MGNIKTPAWYGGGLANALVPGANDAGLIVYVNMAGGGGDNANSGLDPSVPKLTLEGALAICTNDALDTIIVLDYYDQDTTWPISVNKSRVRIIGSPSAQNFYQWCVVQPTGDFAAFNIVAGHVHISGFQIHAGATSGGIEFDGAGGAQGIGIRHCLFASGAYGVWGEAASEPGAGLVVEDCMFIQALTANGILMGSNGPFYRFERNIFDQIAGIAISVTGAPSAGLIKDNVMSLPSNTQGKGITVSSGTRNIIQGNHANYGTTEMVANPYEDSSGGTNHWLENWKVTAPVAPA